MDDLSKKLKDFGQQSVSISGSLLDSLGLEPTKAEGKPTVSALDNQEDVQEELSMDIPQQETPQEVIEEASRDEILGVGTRKTDTVSKDDSPSETVESGKEVQPPEDTSSPFDDVPVEEVSPVEPTVQETPEEPKVESVAPPRTEESLNQDEKQLVHAIMLGSKTITPQEVDVQTEGVAKAMIDGLLLDAVYQRLQVTVQKDSNGRAIRDVGTQYVLAYVLAKWLGWDTETLPERLGWNETTIKSQWGKLLEIIKDKNVVTENPVIDYIRSMETKIARMDNEIRVMSDTTSLSLMGLAHKVGVEETTARTPKDRMDSGLKLLRTYRNSYYRNQRQR